MKALALIVLLALPAAAQTPVRFTSFADLRTEIDGLIEDRSIASLIERLAPDEGQDLQRLMVLETRMRALYTAPLSNVAVVRERREGDFVQQLVAYWTENDRYLFLYLMVHERDAGAYVLQFNVETDIQALGALF